jgi:hypothetical protein
MRKFIDLIKLNEAIAQPTIDEFASMKAIISGKIKQLPDDDETAKALREIEDLLAHVGGGGTGGKIGMINGELAKINDPTVQAAQKELARYILSLDMTPAQRDELFKLWREDKLVDRAKLLSKGKKTFADIVNSYHSNPAIKELTNDLMRIAALGQGKGEFALCVLSKSISKPPKGDLLVDGRKIEVKTTDGGAGRFTDQEVRPGKGFEQAARELTDFVVNNEETPFTLPGSGLSLAYAAGIANQMADTDKFVTLCKNLINIIFDGSDTSAVNRIGDAIKSGNAGVALQEYAQLNFNYYMGKKDDEGVLYINVTKDPISMVYFVDASELASSGLRLHAGTVYITSVDDIRLPYPQMEIVDTTFGANAAAATAKKAATAEKQAATAEKKAAKATADAIRNQIDGTTPTTGRRPKGAKTVPASSPGSEYVERDLSEHRREKRT